MKFLLQCLVFGMVALVVSAKGPDTAKSGVQDALYTYRDVDTQPKIAKYGYPNFVRPTDGNNTYLALVAVVIKADGTVSEAKLVKTNHKEFGEVAEDTVKRWTFTPATVEGSPVGCATIFAMQCQVGTARHTTSYSSSQVSVPFEFTASLFEKNNKPGRAETLKADATSTKPGKS